MSAKSDLYGYFQQASQLDQQENQLYWASINSKDASTLKQLLADCQHYLQRIKQIYEDAKQVDFFLTNSSSRTEVLDNIKDFITEITRHIQEVEYRLQQLQGNTGDTIATADSDPNSVISAIQNQMKGLDSSSPEYAALVTQLLNVLGVQNAQDYQTNADTLAYNRTGFDTRVQQLVALGMSPAAALQAVSSSIPATSAAGVGAYQGVSDLTSAAVANKNAALSEKMGMAQIQSAEAQNADAIAASMLQQQQQLTQQRDEWEFQYYDAKQRQQILELQRPVAEAMYSMAGYGIHIPEYALDTTRTLKDWCYQGEQVFKDVQRGLKNGDYVHIGDALYIKSDRLLSLLNDDNELPMMKDLSPEDAAFVDSQMLLDGYNLKQSACQHKAYGEIRKLFDNPLGQEAFRQGFVANYGPRGYHAQESVSRMMRSKVEAETMAAQMDKVQTALESSETRAEILGGIAAHFATLSPEQMAKFEADLASRGYTLTGDDKVIAFSEPRIVNGSSTTEPDIWSLAEDHIIDIPLTRREFMDAKSTIQNLTGASDSIIFEGQLQNARTNQSVIGTQLKMQELASSKAYDWIKNSNWLSASSALTTTLKTTGLGQALATTGAFVAGAATIGLKAQAARRAARNAHARSDGGVPFLITNTGYSSVVGDE